MKNNNSLKEALLEQKLKKNDPIDLPMDEAFYQNLHNKIMHKVGNTEIKPRSSWSRTWYFLETRSWQQITKRG